jgi:hypothetical protein
MARTKRYIVNTAQPAKPNPRHGKQGVTTPESPGIKTLHLPGFCGERFAYFIRFSLEGDGTLEAARCGRLARTGRLSVHFCHSCTQVDAATGGGH